VAFWRLLILACSADSSQARRDQDPLTPRPDGTGAFRRSAALFLATAFFWWLRGRLERIRIGLLGLVIWHREVIRIRIRI
jgi:hypothetical protein